MAKTNFKVVRVMGRCNLNYTGTKVLFNVFVVLPAIWSGHWNVLMMESALKNVIA